MGVESILLNLSTPRIEGLLNPGEFRGRGKIDASPFRLRGGDWGVLQGLLREAQLARLARGPSSRGHAYGPRPALPFSLLSRPRSILLFGSQACCIRSFPRRRRLSPSGCERRTPSCHTVGHDCVCCGRVVRPDTRLPLLSHNAQATEVTVVLLGGSVL